MVCVFFQKKIIPDSILSALKNRKSNLYTKPEKPISKNTKTVTELNSFFIDESEQAVNFSELGNYKDLI